MKRKTLTLPFSMRAELKVPLGKLFTGDPSETVTNLKILLKEKEPPMFAVVGDYTTMNILDAGLDPDIVVVDYRIMRVETEPFNHGERELLSIKNPQGKIYEEVWKTLAKAVSLNRSASVIVEGEEDLLVLPLISLMPSGSLIVYGQPREGMVVVEVTEQRKRWAEDFMSRMEEN